ncbi:OmpA family protein [Hymenobacter artigasi]|uniref:Outer membrane protein OmpA-like peptidoglycan-associated protein/ABC-type nitrate/sulfonate/bicarbonate transport system substrate-binding protein n=1 Tax=Hymenobacter artigasi TaxID=2719616 RepID=A0ABX1HJA4_9BACT|nr:OmpA family protein [Hymenobacter artigasi]NKI90354.1 outer membrane protein OmpA-like peptidoglycan-associated protein/ABC-type nitrate/sulfonate/bicarbonate transport system substrate-binding protein [Hymenobacter artigasi]
MTTRGKFIIGLLLFGLLYFGINKLVTSGAVFKKADTQSVLLNTIELPATTGGNKASTVVPLATMPGTAPADKGTPLTWEVMAWNSQMAGMLANGGPRSTMGSAAAANGLDMQIVRQDDVSKMQADLVKNALDLQSNPATPGLIVSIMGDGLPAFSAVQDELKKTGTQLQIIPYSVGKSFGEDKLMGPKEWLDNPKLALGKTVACYLRDGDQNIALKWCADNGLKVNPDETTYDPEAVNFMAASDFLVAAEKYILGKPEARTKVVNGKNTGVSVDVVADAVATWTPGDVNIAKQRGGLVNIVSTKDYSNQMPNIMVTTKRWYDAHPKEVLGLMTAFAVAGDQVKSHPEALTRAADISATVYGDQDKPGAYWLKYYKGVSEADRNGEVVELGGSKAFNFSDNLSLFGLDEGGTNIYASVYKTFGDVQKKLYPKELPTYVPLTEMLDLAPLQKLQAQYKGKAVAPAETTQFAAGDEIRQSVSKRAWNIEFNSGQSSFTPQTTRELTQLFDDLVVAGRLKVAVHGHTDNAGDPGKNQQLSEDRAMAVQHWLETKSHSAFPDGRIQVYAHGATEPVASNTTPDGKAKNRRVEVVLGN